MSLQDHFTGNKQDFQFLILLSWNKNILAFFSFNQKLKVPLSIIFGFLLSC